MANKTFPCSGCGACCRRAYKLAASVDFPYAVDVSGKCEKLTEDNRCSVYEKRPLICSVDRVARVLTAPIEDFYRLNILACNQMMEEDGLPLDLRIKIS